MSCGSPPPLQAGGAPQGREGAAPPAVSDALRRQLDAAPRYGANARMLLLQAAQAIAAEEAAEGRVPGRAPPPRRAPGAGPREGMGTAALGSELLALVPAKARPWVPYNARSVATQQARQQVATTLAASYLALLAGELQLRPTERAKQAVQQDPQLQQAAAKAALAHEAALHFSVNTAAQYKAAASKLGVSAAVLSRVPADLLQALRGRYCGGDGSGGGPGEEEETPDPWNQDERETPDPWNQDERESPQAQQQQQEEEDEDEEEEQQQGVGGKQQRRQRAEGEGEEEQPGERKRRRWRDGGDNGDAGARGEAGAAALPDLEDLFGGEEEGGGQGEGEEGALEQRAQAGKEEGRLGEQTKEQQQQQQQQQQQGVQEGEQQQPQPPKQLQPPATRVGAPRRRLVAPPPAAASPTADAATPAVSAAAADGSETVAPAPGAQAAATAAAPGVEAQVAAFVRGVLDPLRAAGLLDDGAYSLVTERATAKVMARHQGASDASFLVREYSAITKLCSALVEHYGSSTAKQ